MININLKYNHWIKVDEYNQIIDAWSSGVQPEKDTSSAILLTSNGGYQFRLTHNGEENPPILDFITRKPIYIWTGIKIEKIVL